MKVRNRKTRILLYSVMVGLSFALLNSDVGWNKNATSAAPVNAPALNAEETINKVAGDLAGRQVSEGFSASLNARESADFILTPALLVQDAISDDAIPTYPSE
jgi:hypothetical protein